MALGSVSGRAAQNVGIETLAQTAWRLSPYTASPESKKLSYNSFNAKLVTLMCTIQWVLVYS